MHKDLDIAGLIDHTLLRADAVEGEVISLCDEAMQYGFYSVCIHPSFIKIAKERLLGSNVKISTVIGFPLGMTLSSVKAFEAAESVREGADELDIVINLGLAKSGRWDAVEREILEICSAAHSAIHKIIIEACYLNDEEKKTACTAAVNAGADFIKTSTGFGPGGAVLEDIKLINSAVNGKAGIKAAGGIKTLNDTLAFIEAGASRIGTSSGVSIMEEDEKA